MRVGRGACDHEVDHTYGVRSQISDLSTDDRPVFQLLRARGLAAPPGSQTRLPSLKGGRDSRGPLCYVIVRPLLSALP
jgi:hypothetical protein